MNMRVVRFDVLMAVSTRTMMCVVTPYTLVGQYWCLSHIYQST